MRRSMLATYVIDPETGKRYPIPAGGADDDVDDAGEGAGADDDQSGEDGSADDLADADGIDPSLETGTVEYWQARARQHEIRANKTQRRMKRLEKIAEQAQKQDTQQDTDQPDADQIRQQVEAEVRAEAAKDRALDKLEAKAARKFRNPDLARKLLADQADDFLDDKGNPDVEAINEALDELLEDEPYLALDAQGDRRFQGTADGGTRNGSDKPSQLTQDDVKRLSREGKHAEIEKARQDGRLDDLLGASK